MKILHTSDLHLGKKLVKASRLDEQCAVIKEIAEIADRECVDVILIVGDMFDSSVPPSEAERVFYRALLTLAERGRTVIALAGNHDDERRMCAAKPLADLQGIVLAGELDYTGMSAPSLADPVPPPSLLAVAAAADYLQKQRARVIGMNGGVRVEKDGEHVNIALVPYPSEARLKRWCEQDYSVAYADRVKLALENACAFFDGDGYNILCTHLFLTKSENADQLGGLVALPASVLPACADYVALGHVHKRYVASKTPYAVYCGAPLQYAYDETRDKSVTVIDTATRKVSVEPLTSGKKLTEVHADTYDDCLNKLDFYKNDYVRLLYGGDPLGREEYATLRAHPAFNDLVVTAGFRGEVKTERRAHLSDGEIFDMFYKSRRKTAPSADTKAAFIELIEEIEHAAD